MRTALLLLLALAAPVLSSTAAATDVWKWVDEKGTTHYSDQPVAGATKIEVRTGNVVGTTSSTYTGSSSSSSTQSGQRAAASYRNFEIWRPEANQSLINTGGTVNVEIRIEPAVRPEHRLDLYLDGRIVTGFPRNTLSYALTEVPRGSHSVNAVVTDQAGQSLAQAATVAFTVRQESIATPPVGPSLRPPPPKPTPRASNKMLTTQPSYSALHNAPTAIDPATNLPVVKKPAPKAGKP